MLRMRNMAESGAPPALSDIYRRGYARFLRVAEAIVGDGENARDVVQDAFVRLIRSQPRFRGEGSLDAWVWRTVVNTACSARRTGTSRRTASDPSVNLASMNGHAEGAGVRKLLSTLPERQRLVLFLRYYADLDYRSIADVLEIQPGTVGATLNQAHSAMRQLLTEVAQ
jgi:RNA polymerase sigma factor (sigma-70 family)